MTMSEHILHEAARIVRTGLPRYLSVEFVVSDVRTESRPGPDGEDYIHVNVILEDGHPGLDFRKVLEFSQAIRPEFERAGVTPIPTISYSNTGEFAR